MADRAPFEPIGAQARWKTVYELLRKTPTGTVVTYKQLADALGLDAERHKEAIRGAVIRAAKEHEEKDKRAVQAVRGEGYRPVEARVNIELARKHQRRASRSLQRGHSKAVNVDLNGVDPQVRAALETIGHAFVLQMDFNKRFEGKQARLEETVREIADSQVQDRKRTDEEISELRARLARLEGNQ